jgi:adenine-specific DNA-methyltransferase
MASDTVIDELQTTIFDVLRVFETPSLPSQKKSYTSLQLPYAPVAKTFNLQNRRYLGNKYKLLEFIKQVIDNEVGYYDSFCDIFAGTGVVGAAFNASQTKIITNDILHSSYLSLKTFFENSNLDINKLTDKIKYLNQLHSSPNYFSDYFADSYFTYGNAALIGTIREEIENIADTLHEKAALVTSLLYAVDKVANTVGHYDAYRKQLTTTQKLTLRIPQLNLEANRNNEVYNLDANLLIRKIKADILYLDPPYNSRQYSDSYHLLENVAHWSKPEVTGIAKKMDRSHIKSQYSLKSAPEALRDLIENADVKHILLSYNNTGETKDSRSNARISDEEIIDILHAKGSVKVFEQNYKAFTTGKSSVCGNSERIFYCKVR